MSVQWDEGAAVRREDADDLLLKEVKERQVRIAKWLRRTLGWLAFASLFCGAFELLGTPAFNRTGAATAAGVTTSILGIAVLMYIFMSEPEREPAFMPARLAYLWFKAKQRELLAKEASLRDRAGGTPAP